MENPKRVVGVQARGCNWESRATKCEILEADRDHIRFRTTFEDTGEIWESLWSPENPTVLYDGEDAEGRPTKHELRQIRTWRNGDELPGPAAQGHNYRDHCLCTVLRHVYGDEFTGYEHNYVFRDGTAYEEDGE